VDERLKKALDISNYMITLNNQKRLLKEKFYEDLIYFDSGSQFLVNQNLMTFVKMLIENGYDTDVVLIDDNDIPVKIQNLETFYQNILDVYFRSANRYMNEYEKIRQSRTVEKLVNYDQN
jgi:hypothetical protein